MPLGKLNRGMWSTEWPCKLLGLVSHELMNEWISGLLNTFGMMLTQEKQRIWKKTTCPSSTLSTTNPTCMARERTWLPRGKWLATHWDMHVDRELCRLAGGYRCFEVTWCLHLQVTIVPSVMSLTATIICGVWPRGREPSPSWNPGLLS
jgi:hypothetical protein